MKAVATIPQPFGFKVVRIDFPDPKECTFESLKAMIPDDCRPCKISIKLEIEVGETITDDSGKRWVKME